MIDNIFFNYSNDIAYSFNNVSITYKELNEKIRYYSNLLISEGSSPVIIYGHKEIEMIILILACIYAHRPYIPIDTCTPEYRISEIKRISGSTLVINVSSEIIQIDNIRFNELDNLENNNNETKSNIAYIIFTSGTSGIPKGVPISLSNLNNFINWITNVIKVSKKINVLNTASFSFDLSVVDIFFSFCNGHSLYGLDKTKMENYNYVFNLIKENNINLIVMTPTFIRLCLTNPDFKENNFKTLKYLYFCGERLLKNDVRKIYERFPNIKIINAYGPTEATSAVSAIEITKDMIDSDEELPIGNVKNMATELSFEDEQIVLSGKSVFQGYLGSNKKIEKYYTGDLGYLKDNKLYYIGRKDNQIKYKGYRIELDDIENNINKIKGVDASAVISKLDCSMTVKTINAFITGKSLSADYIKKELDKLIPGYMMPKRIIILENMPITKNGKIDRKKLEKL